LIKGSLYDLQALFNLNNLLDIKFQPMFLKLLENCLGTGHTDEQKKLFQALHYWITPYRVDRGRDDFLNYYLTQANAYLPGFQPLQSISELRLIRGFNLKIYQALLPYVTVLPEVTPINILSAPKSLLKSLGNGLDDAAVNELIEAGKNKGLDTLEKKQQLLQKLDINASLVTTESNYFLSIAEVSSNELSLISYTVLKRTTERTGQIVVVLISESLNSK
jgi:general secretion pathway protein K